MMTLAHINVAVAGGASSTTVAWFTLAGALVGVLVTGLISLATVTLNHRWQSQSTERQRLQDHNTQVRKERQETYTAYWRAWNGFIHQLRKLQDRVQELPADVIVNRHVTDAIRAMADPEDKTKPLADPEGMRKQLQDLIDKTWDAELEWRTAADALFVIADPAVEEAANAHVTMTEQKIAAAWEGKSYHDENGTAYHSLSNTMRATLLTAVPPEAWISRAPGFPVNMLGLGSRAKRPRFRL
jgi:hypothetical protein